MKRLLVFAAIGLAGCQAQSSPAPTPRDEWPRLATGSEVLVLATADGSPSSQVFVNVGGIAEPQPNGLKARVLGDAENRPYPRFRDVSLLMLEGPFGGKNVTARRYELKPITPR